MPSSSPGSEEPAAEPEWWVRLDLPAGGVDRTDGLVSVLEELRVPGGVRHSRFEGDGTFAIVPISAEGDLLAVRPGWSPVISWQRVDEVTLRERLEALCGPGSTLRNRSLGDESEVVGAASHLDAIAWTTRDSVDTTALVGALTKTPFLALAREDGDLVLSPADPADNDRAFTDVVWLASGPLAVWRSGAECGAAFVSGRRMRQIVWRSAWRVVDPSAPGQVLDAGAPLRAAIDEALAHDGDVDSWIERFRVPRERAPLLRALTRRSPSPAVLGELLDLLGVDRAVLDLLDHRERTQGVVVIEPRGFGRQAVDELRRSVGLVPPRKRTLLCRHPLVWFGGWGVAAVVLGICGVIGLTTGHELAGIPLVLAAVGTARIVLYAALAPVRNRAASTDSTPRLTRQV